MQFIALTTSRYLFIDAESKNDVKRKFEDIMVSGEWIVWSIENKSLIKSNKTMTTKSAVATIPLIDEEIAKTKKELWGNLGVNIYKAELQLQAQAQSAVKKLIIPTRIEDVANAEATLKAVKAEFATIKESRLSLTRPVDAKITELAISENMGKAPCQEVENAIIALKKADEERRRIESQKLQALQECRQFLTTTRNNADATFKNKIITKVGIVYEHALGKGDVTMEMLPEFIEFAIERMGAADFAFEYPKKTFSLVSDEKYQEMCVELLTFDTTIYLSDYENQLKLKFSDYEVALKNKAIALAKSKQEEESKAAAVASANSNANVAAKLDAVAINPVVSTGVKDLKKSYAVDMPETLENFIVIMTAFTAHIDLCRPKLNVNKWFSFGASQAAGALAKVKCDDESFAPVGIIFKTVDKL